MLMPILFVVNLGCGDITNNDKANAIGCANMQTLRAANALPVSGINTETLRAALTVDAFNVLSGTDIDSEFSLLAYCDY